MHGVIACDKAYGRAVPRLWKDTIEEHRRDVRSAIVETTIDLVRDRGVRGVTMGLIAQRAGISRATLYKYFAGVDDILIDGHAEHVRRHLAELREACATAGSAREAVERLIDRYAEICFRRSRSGAPDVAALVHDGDQHDKNADELRRLFVEAVRAAQEASEVRTDVAADLLAAFCLKAAEAASTVDTSRDAAAMSELVKERLAPPR